MSPQSNKDICIFMQVINDTVFFWAATVLLSPHKHDTPGSRSAVQGLRGLQTKSHFPVTSHIFGNNDNKVSISMPL
jgi:hypothetical protein